MIYFIQVTFPERVPTQGPSSCSSESCVSCEPVLSPRHPISTDLTLILLNANTLLQGCTYDITDRTTDLSKGPSLNLVSIT